MSLSGLVISAHYAILCLDSRQGWFMAGLWLRDSLYVFFVFCL